MSSPINKQLIMVVAQKPFETEMNRFCKLVPLVYLDGTIPDEDAFPNDHEIWWMLTTNTVGLAEPGRLVVGRIEPANRYEEEDPNSSRYQADRDSVRPISSDEGIQILTIADGDIDELEEIVSGSYQMNLIEPPSGKVLLRWRSHTYGLFETISNRRYSPTDPQSFSFFPEDTAERRVMQIENDQLTEMVADHLILGQIEVSLSRTRRSESFDLRTLDYEILLAPGLKELRTSDLSTFALEPIDRKLNRFAKQVLNRKKRQELRALLDEIEDGQGEVDDPESLLEAIGRIRSLTGKQDAAIDAAVAAMIQSGYFGEERIRKAEKDLVSEYLEDKTAELQSKVEQALIDKRQELKELERKAANLEQSLSESEQRRRWEMEKQITEERERTIQHHKKKEEQLEQREEELKKQEKSLLHNLERVVSDLKFEGDAIVRQFLTIAPLINATVPHVASISSKEEGSDGSGYTSFDLPEYIVSGFACGKSEVLDEKVFFDRFTKLVSDSGFSYQDIVLKAYHVSVKCGALTILEGPSGTGKSSLPMLYSKALMGDAVESGRPDCLMVNVNPSWMEVRDLLGHLNTLEGRFYPAESGLFQYLLYAQEEYKSQAADTCIYLVCLDEMNLSQVEHYFGDLMMVLERSNESRVIRCFAAEASSPACPFHKWPTVSISPGVRFTGTVNFDETTRLLSDRLLDRANVIRLESDYFPSAPTEDLETSVNCTGPMVSLRDFEDWIHESALPPDLAKVLDKIGAFLHEMGFPISARVYRAIIRFVGSAKPIISQESAFDLQIAQRIVPRIRNLLTRRQVDALDNMIDYLSKSDICGFESSIRLLNEVREKSNRPSLFGDD